MMNRNNEQEQKDDVSGAAISTSKITDMIKTNSNTSIVVGPRHLLLHTRDSHVFGNVSFAVGECEESWRCVGADGWRKFRMLLLYESEWKPMIKTDHLFATKHIGMDVLLSSTMLQGLGESEG